VNQMARINLRIMEADRNLAHLRTDIASNLEPQRIEALASKMGSLRPIETTPLRPGALPGGRQPAFAQSGSRGRLATVPTDQPDDAAFGGGVNPR